MGDQEIKWLKIKTHMFDDEKIKLIERMPDGDSILIIWIKLLVQAGKTNASGYIFLSENIPYSDEMMATIFDRPIGTIRLALKTFHEFGMIEIENDYIKIANWEKHQNVEGMDRVRELNAKRNREYRKRKKHRQLAENSDHDVIVTSRDSTDSDSDSDTEREKEKETVQKSQKYKYESVHMKLAELLLREIRKNQPALKEPNLEAWANEFRLMMERDGREGKEIQDIILFAQAHEFWHINILSAKKLRKQFDQLVLQKNEPQKKQKGENRDAESSYKNDYSKYDFSKRRNLL